MGGELLSEFMWHLDTDDEMELGHAPKKISKWLEKLGLPLNELRFLQWSWPQVSGQIGPIELWPSCDLKSGEETKALLKHKCLQLGHAPNGDFFVLNFANDECRPGYVSMPEFVGDSSEPALAFVPIARSLESLLFRLTEGRFVPADFHEAKEFIKFLREEKQGDSKDLWQKP